MSAALMKDDQERLVSVTRIEKAKELLTFWAFAHWAYTNRVEVKVGYTGGTSVMTEFQGGKSYKPFGFKTLTNAKETRRKLGSTIPIGGSVDINTKLDRAVKIDELLQENLSVRDLTLLWALFIPPCVYGSEKRLTDAKIARVLGFLAPRACKLKVKAIELVALDLLSPVFD